MNSDDYEFDVLNEAQEGAASIGDNNKKTLLSSGKHIFITNQTSLVNEQVTFQELIIFLKDQLNDGNKEKVENKIHYWVDLQGLDNTEISEICELLSIHPLTKKDIIRQETREKCEFFSNHLFLVVNEIHYAPGSNILVAATLNMLLFSRVVFTFHSEEIQSTYQVLRMMKYNQNGGGLPSSGWIIYAFLDSIVDIYIDLVDKIMLETQSLDELVLVLSGVKQNELFTRIGLAGRRVTNLHSGVFGKSEIISVLLRDEKLIPQDMMRYLKNVQDHILRMLQKLTLSQRLLSNLNNIYMARVSLEVSDASNSVNRNMRKFTAISTIFIPLTLLAGIMGMNVRLPGMVGFPNGDSYYFFMGIILIMALFSLIVGGLFKRAKWL